jgi:excisionase family DNA binding protein
MQKNNCLTVSVAEAAEILGTSEVTVYRLLSRGILTACEHIRTKRIPREQVEDIGRGTR